MLVACSSFLAFSVIALVVVGNHLRLQELHKLLLTKSPKFQPFFFVLSDCRIQVYTCLEIHWDTFFNKGDKCHSSLVNNMFIMVQVLNL